MAEEYRLQLADRMPMAAAAMEKATGLAGRELLDMMKKGKLISSEILPKFGRELRKLAQENGALAKVLNTNKVAQSRMTTAYQKFMNVIFKSGFGEALTKLFEKITDFFSEMEGMGILIGRTFEFVINVITGAFTALKVPFVAFSKIFKMVNDLVEGMNTGLGEIATSTVPRIIGAFAALALAATKIGRKFFLISAALIAIRATMEEVIALTTKGVVGSLERKLGVDLDSTTAASAIGGQIKNNVLSGGLLGMDNFNQFSANLNKSQGFAPPAPIVFNNTKMTVTSNSDFHQQLTAAKVHGGR